MQVSSWIKNGAQAAATIPTRGTRRRHFHACRAHAFQTSRGKSEMHDYPARTAGSLVAPGTQQDSTGRPRSLISTAVALALAACAVGGMSSAIANPAPEPQAQSTGPDASSSDEAPELTEVTVTGSRIARRDFEANSPITTVQEDLLE